LKKIIDLLKKIFVRSNAKNIILLSSGALFGQAISFILQPIATRLYAPEDFGMLALITSFASMFTPVVTLQYHVSVVNSEEDEIYPLCKLNFLIILMVAVLAFFGLWIYNSFYSNTYASVGIWIYSSIVILILDGVIAVVDSFNNRKSEYKLMTSVAVVRASVSGVFKIVLGLLKTGFFGILISYFLSLCLGIKRQAKSLLKVRRKIFSSKTGDMIRVAKKYSSQPLLALPGIFITQFSYSVLPIIILPLYGDRECGFFSLSFNMLGIPLGIIALNVAKIFFKNASDEFKNHGNFKKSFMSTSFLLLIISLTGFSILWFIAEPMFGFVFGSEWSRSGTFVKILVPMYIARFVVTGLMHGFIISNKQVLKCCVQAMFIVEIFVIKYFATKFCMNIESFLNAINWAYMVTYVVLFLLLFKISHGKTINKKEESLI